jgi:hypothetical protein
MPAALDMRQCTKCLSLFFNPEVAKSACPSDGRTHAPGRFNFILDFGRPPRAHEQGDWYRCVRCQAVFFGGPSGIQGICDRHGRHQADTHQNFVLPHGLDGSDNAQTGWEFCTKCFVMFYDGLDKNGNCAGTGEHQRHPDAFHFVLTHDAVPIDPGTALHPVDE